MNRTKKLNLRTIVQFVLSLSLFTFGTRCVVGNVFILSSFKGRTHIYIFCILHVTNITIIQELY